MLNTQIATLNPQKRKNRPLQAVKRDPYPMGTSCAGVLSACQPIQLTERLVEVRTAGLRFQKGDLAGVECEWEGEWEKGEGVGVGKGMGVEVEEGVGVRARAGVGVEVGEGEGEG